ncbi:MAG: outer membrane lipoprotein carrier protein LolA [Pseudomonadota bacterium]|nr:outer membrane lipoprotein carrier protein LolA [Pseudomonadota bacterium]
MIKRGFRGLLLFALALCIAAPAASADPVPGQAIIGAGDVLRGRFTEERQMKGFNAPLRANGHFVVAPGQGLIWAIEKPFPTTSIITPKGLAQEVGGINVMQTGTKKIPFLLHLYDMLGGVLAGDWHVLEKDFIMTRAGDDREWEVDLQPRQANNPAMPFNSIIIKGSRYVASALLVKPDGDSDYLTFSGEQVTRAPVSPSEQAAIDSVGR